MAKSKNCITKKQLADCVEYLDKLSFEVKMQAKRYRDNPTKREMAEGIDGTYTFGESFGIEKASDYLKHTFKLHS